MSLKEKHSEASRSIFMGSMVGLANTGAVVATFFTAPLLYSVSVGWVADFASDHYGNGWVGIVDFTWFVLVALLVFFSSRASLSTTLVMGGLALATKFL